MCLRRFLMLALGPFDVIVFRLFELEPSYVGKCSSGYHGFLCDIQARLLRRRVVSFRFDKNGVLKIWVK